MRNVLTHVAVAVPPQNNAQIMPEAVLHANVPGYVKI